MQLRVLRTYTNPPWFRGSDSERMTLTSKTLGSRILPGMDYFLSVDHESGCGMVPLVISSINDQWPTTNGKFLLNVTLPLQLNRMRIAALPSVELNLLVLSLAIQPQGLCWSNHGPPLEAVLINLHFLWLSLLGRHSKWLFPHVENIRSMSLFHLRWLSIWQCLPSECEYSSWCV
jgi:hypothetical protein